MEMVSFCFTFNSPVFMVSLFVDRIIMDIEQLVFFQGLLPLVSIVFKAFN